MTHSDPYRLIPGGRQDDAPERAGGAGVVRALLWVVLVVSVVGNTVASAVGGGTGVHLAAGGITVLCAALLVVGRVRRSR
ncbi:hypothetical protein [Streptomyces montanisoli]|uniref:Uncharacterized protein n=1 Tax=Streptomyces montanisoli TaxID=2798581 RepID=A0A940MA34_9ACTN|nr:hypothetical protein [Streptomyces montanisoli]MBP0456671.1 hypothetical protein [Streptomyces montanisoli]